MITSSSNKNEVAMQIKNFDEYFENYKRYDNGGTIDQTIINNAKKIYVHFGNLPEILNLKEEYETYMEENPSAISEETAQRYRSINCSAEYADYVQNSKYN